MVRAFLFAFFLLGFAFANAQTNLVVNGDMEDWDSWSSEVKSWGRYLDGEVEKSTDAQSGKSSILLRTTYSGIYVNFIYSNEIDFEAGKLYKGSFYYKVLSGLFFKLEYSINTFQEVDFDKRITDLPIGDWKRVDFEYTPTKSAKFNFQLYIDASPMSEILFDNVSIALAESTSIGRENKGDSLSIYPNPTTDYLYLSNPEGLTSVAISAMGGACAKRVQMDSDGRIDVRHLSRGAYVVHVKSKNDTFYFKFIKN